VFLSLPALVPLATLRWTRSGEHHLSYDHVIGTSLDLVVWTSSAESAERAESAALDEIQRLASIPNTRVKDVSSDLEGFNELVKALPIEVGPVPW
jgi:hypothetical protein